MNAEDWGLYQPIGESEHFIAYQNAYKYPASLTVSEEAYNSYRKDSYNNPFAFQNALSKLFFDVELFDVTEYSVLDKAVITCRVPERGIIYLYSEDINASAISVNGIRIPVPDYFYGITGSSYPSFYNNGILSLGCYENETVQIEITHHSWAENIQKSTVHIAVLDFDAFVKTTQQHFEDYSYIITDNGLQFQLTAKGNEYLFLPVYMQENWRCTVNGLETKPSTINNVFLMIPLKEGKNHISLIYESPYRKLSIILSVIGIVLLLLWIILSMYIPENKAINRIYSVLSILALRIFIIIYIIYLLLVDIIPFIYTFL